MTRVLAPLLSPTLGFRAACQLPVMRAMGELLCNARPSDLRLTCRGPQNGTITFVMSATY